MAIFTRAQSDPQFQPPNFNPNPQYPHIDVGSTLDSVFNAYMQSRQDERAQQMAGLQTGVLQGQLAEIHRQQALQNIQETAQFGAPARSFTPQDIQMAGGPQSLPMVLSPDNMDKLTRLREGLLKLGGRDPQTLAAQGLKARGAEADIAKTQAEAEKLSAEAGALPAQRGMKAEEALRGELQALSKPFIQVRDSMGRIEAAAKNPSAAGDLALIFNYMKVLDPGSTVREGEFATAQNSAGVPARIMAKYNKVINGERLDASQRADFVDRARELYKSQESIQRRQEEQYRSLSGRVGARPENVILDQSLPLSGSIETRRLKNGQTVRVQKQSDGSYVEVP